jgi:hypothetical protein
MTKDEALKMALETIQIMSQQGDFSNGVTDPTNTMDEGDRRIGWLADDAIKAIRQALDQLPDTTKMIDTGTDRGLWSDVEDATKWVDDLRGGETEFECPRCGHCCWTPDDMAYRPGGLSLEKPPVKTYCGGKPNYCEPEEWDHPPMRDCDCEHCKEYWSDVVELPPGDYEVNPELTKREWQGLTDGKDWRMSAHGKDFISGALWAESLLKSKNGF